MCISMNGLDEMKGADLANDDLRQIATFSYFCCFDFEQGYCVIHGQHDIRTHCIMCEKSIYLAEKDMIVSSSAIRIA